MSRASRPRPVLAAHQTALAPLFGTYESVATFIFEHPLRWVAAFSLLALLPIAGWIAAPCATCAWWCRWLDLLSSASPDKPAFGDAIAFIATIQLAVVGFVCPLAASAVSRAAIANDTAKASLRIYFIVSGIWPLLGSSTALLVSTVLVLAATNNATWAGPHLLVWAIGNVVVLLCFLHCSFRFLDREGERDAVTGFIEQRLLPRGQVCVADAILVARTLPFYAERVEEVFLGKPESAVTDTYRKTVQLLLRSPATVAVHSSIQKCVARTYSDAFRSSLVACIHQQKESSAIRAHLKNWAGLAQLSYDIWGLELPELGFERLGLEGRCNRITVQAFYKAGTKAKEVLPQAIAEFFESVYLPPPVVRFVLLEIAYSFGYLEECCESNAVQRTVSQSCWEVLLYRWQEAGPLLAAENEPRRINSPNSPWFDLQDLERAAKPEKVTGWYPDSLLYFCVLYYRFASATEMRWGRLAPNALLDWVVIRLDDHQFRLRFCDIYSRMSPKIWDNISAQFHPTLPSGELVPRNDTFAATFDEQVERTKTVVRAAISRYVKTDERAQ